MSKAKVINFPSQQRTDPVDAAFLTLIDNDIAKNPHRVRPLAASLLERMQRLAEAAEECEQHERLQG